jgi:tRNA(Ile)-lysidine synthase TilS/MesJ
MSEKLLKVCGKCVLPESFPGLKFDSQGICNFCSTSAVRNDQSRDKTRYKNRFDELLKIKKGTGCYDAIMCYSGGKDSTFTLKILKEDYGLNILALTFDNGFISEQARKNILLIVEKLGIDHYYLKPRFDLLSEIFRQCALNDVFTAKTIERASMICTACMSIIKFSALRLAIEKRIPLIAFGWSPGQAPITSSIMKNNPSMVKAMQKAVYEPLYRIGGNLIRPYFLEEEHFSLTEYFPYNVHPLAFLDYNEAEIFGSIESLGWRSPQDVDRNSTNCLLNSFANVVHKQHYHFNPYSFELAGLVREGYLDRETALERLNQEEDPSLVDSIKERLGMMGHDESH